ncbi:AlpA family transcriptional regulator [Marinobacterium halophilum]|uniref:AlpA family transcriptional regulator n=1 Tax=Marinobacterium halophilum TaxID=267374 RepID=A0A2P8EKK3_9GAMM|nr:AlpA family phage regulatory protein [Marinobacterium halophilum]PSL09978.1 AlpA family transcriptional regulator [Marinobacterium halophilum]
MTEKMLKINELEQLISISESTIYKLVKKGLFPEQVRISTRCVRWRLSEVQEWMQLGQNSWKKKQANQKNEAA